MLYDPPSGWQFGFPREYKPLPGETVEQTLLRDGYPIKLVEQGMAKHCRFIGSDKEFCLHCGAGVGKFRREGEGTCPECDPQNSQSEQTEQEEVAQYLDILKRLWIPGWRWETFNAWLDAFTFENRVNWWRYRPWS